MSKNIKLLISYKVFFALLGFSAVITEIAILSERGVFNPVNFFSYFTIETNVLVSAVFLLSAIALAAGKNHRLDQLRTATTLYIAVVGIGFSVLLANIEGITLTAVPWDNIVLHYIIPVAVVIDFVLDRPSNKISFVKGLRWLLFPIAYLVYSLTRGATVGWYPYPFLDPGTDGPFAVAVVVAGLMMLSIGLLWILTKYTGPRKLVS